ncbi:hypothetical protein TRVL_09585 [Trypanosoma vivax]|nr:hypothetical protein TRVL_09585 [Trypanosoma vivax]
MASRACGWCASRSASGFAWWSAERPSKRGRSVSPSVPKGPETTSACAEQRAVLPLWMSGALQLNVLCEDGSRAVLEVKKRAAAPETMNSGANVVSDSTAREGGQHYKQAGRIARPEARREAVSNSGRSGENFWRASGSYGRCAASSQVIEGLRKRHCHDKSAESRSAPRGFGFGSEPHRQGNVDDASVGTENVHNKTLQRVYKETLTGNVGRARASFYCEFEAGEKQRRAGRNDAAVADGSWEGTGSDASLGPSWGSGGKSHKADAANDAV